MSPLAITRSTTKQCIRIGRTIMYPIERLQYRPSLMEPFQCDKRNPAFREAYKQLGYPLAIRKVMSKGMHIEYTRILIHRFRPDRITKKVIKIILGQKNVTAIKKMIGK